MAKEENKKSKELNNIPRYLKQNVSNEEIDELLKEAETQISGKKKKSTVNNTVFKKPISNNRSEEKLEDDFIEQEPLVIKNQPEPVNPYKEKLTIGRVIANFLEFVWTVFKLAVLVTVVTVIAGFLLSRDMMIRGRNGDRQCLQGVAVSSSVYTNKATEKTKVDKWLATVKREKVTLETDDQKILVARKIIAKRESNKWVVILHGYNGNMEDIYDIAMHYADEGYNILMPDLRAHGESEGSIIGMGWLDRLDIINWIDVILEENVSAEVVIHGIDMGAETALMLSGEPVKDSIKAIVAEGAYTSAWDVIRPEYEIRHEKLPVFPFMYMMNPVLKVWGGYTLKEADAVKQVKNSKIPILLIRGQNDTYSTVDMMKELNQAIASEHELYVMPSGGHEDCRYAEPDNYYNRTFEFVGRYVK